MADMVMSLRQKYEQRCPECKVPTVIVEDHQQGDLICSGCGLVMEQCVIDESSEWRTFSNSDSGGEDPNRVGGPTNHLLKSGGLGTTIGKAANGKDGFDSHNLTRLQNRTANPDRQLMDAFRNISNMCDRLTLIQSIKDRAQEVFRDIAESKSIRGRGASAIHAACIFIACKQEGHPRTFKEICAVAPDASKKDIGRCYKFIVHELEKNEEMNQQYGNDPVMLSRTYVNRWCSNLALDQDVRRVCQAVLDKMASIDLRSLSQGVEHIYTTKTAAVIFMTCQLKEETKRSLTEVARVTGTAEVTIRSMYKDIHPVAAAIVPAWYAGPEEIEKLPLNP